MQASDRVHVAKNSLRSERGERTVSGVLLVTCNSESMTRNLRRSAADAVDAMRRFDPGCSVRERHLYPNAVSKFGLDQASALATAPRRRTPAQWKAAALSELLLGEVRMSDTLVIAAPLIDGTVPAEILDWSEHLARAARTDGSYLSRRRGKLAIVVVEDRNRGADASAKEVCNTLHRYLKDVGIADVVLVEADADGYPLRQGPLLMIASRQAVPA